MMTDNMALPLTALNVTDSAIHQITLRPFRSVCGEASFSILQSEYMQTFGIISG